MTPTQIRQDLMDTSGESAVPHDAIRRWCREKMDMQVEHTQPSSLKKM